MGMELHNHMYSIPRLTFSNLEFIACSPMGDPENDTVRLDWILFEKQLLQEDGSIVIVFKNEENGKDPQQIHIRYGNSGCGVFRFGIQN